MEIRDIGLSVLETLRREHRGLDDLFGRFLGAAQAGNTGSAREAIRIFDEALRLHTAAEERSILAPPGYGSHKLAPPEIETDEQRLHRELLLEHVQVRELSAMILRLLDEKNDLDGARRLAPNLARRWDAHTVREERELFRLKEV